MKELVDGAFNSSLSQETKEKIMDLINQDKNGMIKNKKEILNECVKKKLIKKNEIKNFSQDYLVEFMNALLDKKKQEIPLPEEVKKAVKKGAKVHMKLVFVTTSKPILQRKEELNERFNEHIIVADPLESILLLQEEMQGECDCPKCKAKRKENIDYIG